MAEERVQRRLAAIMAADVVGYSRLMGANEAATLAALKAHRKELVDAKIAELQGRIVKLTGDGMLVEFSSVVNAVACAAEIQSGMCVRNTDIPEDRRIEFRIGVNLGDVVVEDGDIFGDGVNVAARLEGIAQPGGICVSASVREQTGNRLNIAFEDIGDQALKNIERPVRVYRVVLAPPIMQATGGATPDLEHAHGENPSIAMSPFNKQSGEPDENNVALSTTLAGHTKEQAVQDPRNGVTLDSSRPPVIAVIPFENLSTDERWTRFADGLSADIMADLARHRDLAVIARQTMLSYKGLRRDVRSLGKELNADYALEGTLQAAGNEVRIAVQLVDARTEVALWAARYDRPADELFAMQDSVTESVINVLATSHGKLPNLQRDMVRRKHPASLHAYDYYLLGVEAQDIFTLASNRQAIRLLSRAVELDPGLARAWSSLGLAYTVNACNAFSDDPSAQINRAKTCLEHGLSLDPADSVARICLADLRAPLVGLKSSTEEHDAALAMAPNDADTLAMFACSRALVAGDPWRGYEVAKRAIRLNPHVPWYHGALGRCGFVLGLYEECLAAFRQTAPGVPTTLLFLAMAHAMLNQKPEAREIAARLRDDFPTFTAAGFIRAFPVTNPPAIAAIREGSRRAGLS